MLNMKILIGIIISNEEVFIILEYKYKLSFIWVTAIEDYWRFYDGIQSRLGENYSWSRKMESFRSCVN